MQIPHIIRNIANGGLLILLMGILCAFVPTGKQDTASPDEPTLKALFVYNFTKHIEWPAAVMNSARFTVGFYGANEVRDQFVRVSKGRTAFDKPMEVRTINGIDQISGLHILYIGKLQSGQAEKVIQQFSDKGVLIITEDKSMIAKGAGINMIRKGENLRFELNEPALRKSGLKVSNHLISLALTNR